MNGFHSYSFDHPQLGQLSGRTRNDRVTQFRSIPYGYIPARFRQARLVEELSPKQRQCQDYTFACPQVEMSLDPFGGPVSGEESRRYNEFDCLNLTVTVPTELLQSDATRKVPVMVYVHGGGFMTGAHHGAVHDMTRMVTLACNDSKPTIIVSFNYRLHFLGMLACQDILEEAHRVGEPPGNFALYDQRLAFLWVRKYIAGFGGDVGRITAFGESAGSASLCFHLSSTVPLFDRVVLQSGTASTISPSPVHEKEKLYIALLNHLGIDVNDPLRLTQLRDVPINQLVEATQVVTNSAFSPLAHPSFFPAAPCFLNHAQIVADCPWVDAYIVGDATFEGYLFSEPLRTVGYKSFRTHLVDTLGDGRAQAVLDLYDMSADLDRNLFWTRLAVFCGDIMFSMPTHDLCRAIAAKERTAKGDKKPANSEILPNDAAKSIATHPIKRPKQDTNRSTLLISPNGEPSHLTDSSTCRSLLDAASSSSSSSSSTPNPARHQATKREIYRYTLSLTNPFPGSVFYSVTGHHFIELLYLFTTLLERFPLQIQKTVSLEFAKMWIAFANGESPWPRYQINQGVEASTVAGSLTAASNATTAATTTTAPTNGVADARNELHVADNIDTTGRHPVLVMAQKEQQQQQQQHREQELLAVADAREGWVVRTRVQDEHLSKSEDGAVLEGRRYRIWERLGEILRSIEPERGPEEVQRAVEALSFPTLVTLGQL